MNKLIAVVGMAGAGKTTASDIFTGLGYTKIRFGQATMDEITRRGLEVNEENESFIRETLRIEHGMDAYAKLNEPKIREAIKRQSVVIDGLYSWQEYLYLKPKFPELKLVAIHSSPTTRYKRLSGRKERPLTFEEAQSRDYSELENIHKSEPIAMADFTIVNEGTVDELKMKINELGKK